MGFREKRQATRQAEVEGEEGVNGVIEGRSPATAGEHCRNPPLGGGGQAHRGTTKTDFARAEFRDWCL